MAKLGEQNQEFTSPVDGMSGGEKFLTGIGRGAHDIGQGVSQIIRDDMEAKGFAPEGSADAYTAEKNQRITAIRKVSR